MASRWKDILYAGRWHCRDGRTFDCPPEKIPYFRQRMADMIAAGLPVPLSWEHQPQLKPGDDSSDDARAARAKFALGHASDVRSDAGFLEARLEVPNPDDAKRLPAVRFVSPFIEWDFRDGTGKVWEGPSITHIAVTPRPIQHTQQPFAMSQTADTAPIALSLADYEGPMDDDQDPKKKKKPDEPEETEIEGGAETDSEAKTSQAQGLSDEEVPELVDLLAQHKIILGDGVTSANFCDRLKAALHTKAAHDGTGEGGPNNPDMQAQATEVGLSAEGQTWKTRAERAESKIVALEQKSLLGRIKQLGTTGRIGKKLCEALETEAGGVSLSLDPTSGNVASMPLLFKIEAYEKLQPNRTGFADAAALSAEATEVEPPHRLTKDNRDAQEKAGDDIAAMAGVRKKAA